ncbi:unnamed protein product [Adineta ricciae]|uniref:Apple domain-containing protein n=1 Tax=Adineta ricciae TaxID=249248 RepID=A0A815WG03_ADIRI|nr:unnamed protein product [Adineta ricciae]CAF1598001.1 unnamed protein product [Adineta ricciae]
MNWNISCLVIVFFLNICNGYISQSLIRWSSYGYEYLPINQSIQLLSSITVKSSRECLDACHKNNLCRIFNYETTGHQQCQLFEGDTKRLGSIILSAVSSSIVGIIEITPSLYIQYGQSCSSTCIESRYLECNVNSICECPEHTYWDPSVMMCLLQLPLLGASCDHNLNMCREDLNYVCLQFNQCGPLSLLYGVTIADINTIIDGSPTVGMDYPMGVTIYETDGESLIITDSGTAQIVHVNNADKSKSNISVLVPNSWASGETLFYPYEMFLDIDDSYKLYLCDSGNNRIVMFSSMQYVSPPPTIVINGSAGVYTQDLDKLVGPYGVKRDNRGNLYITDFYNHRVMFWSPNATSGVMIVGNNTAGNDSTQLNSPTGLFVDSYNSMLYVTDTWNHRIQLYNLTGSPPYKGITIAGTGSAGSDENQLNGPCGIWVSNKTGALYVVDSSNNRIQRWDKGAKAGVTIAGNPNGNAGSNATMLNIPNGIAINTDETRMYITDSLNSRIQRFDLI